MGEFDDLKVGVVVPIYNVEKYLPQCLDSVVSQSYGNLSVLLVSDGDDKCLDIALDYARKDSRFIVIDKENGGQGSARNVGIEFFGGGYDIESKPQIECYKILDSKTYIYIYMRKCGGSEVCNESR